jgi:acyl-CoA dehydrogenase family protein 9
MSSVNRAEDAGGLVVSLFRGQLDGDAVMPWPTPDAETAETSEEVHAMVSGWMEENVDPAEIDATAQFPEGLVGGLAELGLLGLTFPEEHDGAGCKQHTYTRVMEAVSYRCPSTATVLGAHLGLGTKALLLVGTDEQKAEFLPRLASGELLGAFALTEPQAGSDAAALRTRAEPRPDGGWKLDGTKVWITNAGMANFFTVFARTPHPEKPDAPIEERPITAFAVLSSDGGVTTGAEEHKMGLKGSSTTEVVLEDVVIPAGRMLGPEGKGFRVALEVLNGGRHSLAACCLGQAKLATELAHAHAGEREQYGAPIARFGMIREMLAGMSADVYAMEAATYMAAGLVDRGGVDASLESACCKLYATERLWTLANDALQVAGGTGFMKEYAYERIVRDARVNLIFEGTNQVLRMMIALRGWKGLANLGPADGPGGLEGVHESLAEEAARCRDAAARMGVRAAEAVSEHGKALRHAQHAQKRLADMAVALTVTAAVLSRATHELAAGAGDEVLDLARLAARRELRAFDEAEAACAENDDALIERVAGRATGLA